MISFVEVLISIFFDNDALHFRLCFQLMTICSELGTF